MATTLITGASAGLGAALAEGFAKRGHDLILVARRKALLDAQRPTLEAAGAASVHCYAADLADRSALEALLGQLERWAPDNLINNAALGHWDLTWQTPEDKLTTLLDLNVHALARLSHAFVAARHGLPGCLMNVASGAGYALFPGCGPYCASKFFVTALTESLAQELAATQAPLAAKLYAPGPIASEFLARSLEGSSLQLDPAETDAVVFKSPEEAAELGLTLFDSDASVGVIEPDGRLTLSGGRHRWGSLGAEGDW